MSHKWMIRTAVLAMLLAATTASAGKMSITGFGGLAVPTGDFSDKNKFDAKLGFQAGGAFDYKINERFALGVDGSWSRSKHGAEGDVIDLGPGIGTAKYDKDKFTTTQFGVHGKAFLPTTGPFGAYGLAGVGMYKVKEKWEGTITPAVGPAFTDNGDAATDNKVGFRFGAGAMRSINELWSLGVEGDYNFIKTDKSKDGVSSLQYMGLRGMLTVHLPQ